MLREDGEGGRRGDDSAGADTVVENRQETETRIGMERATSEKEFFAEKKDCIALIVKLTSAAGSEIHQKELENILEKYQEQPHLLDPSLEELLGELMRGVRTILRRWNIRNESDTDTEEAESKRAVAASSAGDESHTFFSKYQVFRDSQMDRLLSIVYTFCKVRGYKSIVKFLPHDVADLEPVVHLLHSQDRGDHKTWRTRYSLLVWLSILVRVPFDLSTIDSTSLATTAHVSEKTGVEEEKTVTRSPTSYHSLVNQLLYLGKEYLSDSGATRDAAAVMLGQLLTRPDMSARSENDRLAEFFTWSAGVMQKVVKATSGSREARDVFLTTGVFHALTEILKHGDRALLLSHISVIFDAVLDVTDAMSEGHVGTLQRKMTVKLAQRIGLTFLPPRIPQWRYKRGERSLTQNLTGCVDDSTRSAASETSSDASKIAREDLRNAGADKDDATETNAMAEEIEDVIDLLLNGLRDRDTIVRWSAAKGIGRLTGRLPTLALADEVVQFVEDLFSEDEGPGAWHGGCLAMAELARRGLLLPSRLSAIVPLIEKALQYDKQRGTHSVGAHVRDAGCYVCWAFARAYDPVVMRPHVRRLACAMMVTAICDREINCRRAASAAFQENVGRQGNQNFPNGIEILTAADYFSLGNRRNAYTVVSVQVAKFPEYRAPLIDHLATIKLFHWDPTLRELSARALSALTPLATDHMLDAVLPRLASLTLDSEVSTRHGATRGVAEIVVALTKCGVTIPADLQAIIRNITMKIEKRRLYRGRGGTVMRQAVCLLIRAIADAELPLSRRAQERLLKSLLENVRQPREETREDAVLALGAFASGYWSIAEKKEEDDVRAASIASIVVEPLLTMLDHDVCSSRSGGALGLGVLPSSLTAVSSEMLDKVVRALVGATKMKTDPELRSAQARRDAVRALAGVCAHVGFGARDGSSPKKVRLTLEHGRLIFECILRCFDDYETTDQGDVGSVVRSAAVDAVDVIVTEALRLDSQASSSSSDSLFLTRAAAVLLLSALAKQSCEKIDAVRTKAGRALFDQLHRSEPTELPLDRETRERLMKILPSTLKTSMNWSAVDATFPLMGQLLGVPSMGLSVASGLCLSSANRNAQSLVDAARGALIGWIKERKTAKDVISLETLCDHLLEYMARHRDQGRVSVPVLETFEFLLSNEDELLDALAPPNELWKKLTDGIKRECRGSSDIKKVVAAAKLLVALIGFPGPARAEALRGILTYMCHRYPKVRQTTAEAFFIRIVNKQDIIDDDEKFDSILGILSATSWDGPLAVVRPKRNELYELVLGVSAPQIKRKAGEKNSTTSGDGGASKTKAAYEYGSLVREMHY